MIGLKINEFDNSPGTVKDFNKIFTETPLNFHDNVEIEIEILDIVDKGFYSNNVFLRNVKVGEHQIIEHDFRGELYYLNEDFFENNVRFKYQAKDKDGNVIAKSYTIQDMSKKIGWSESYIKDYLSKHKTLYRNGIQLTRKEL